MRTPGDPNEYVGGKESTDAPRKATDDRASRRSWNRDWKALRTS